MLSLYIHRPFCDQKCKYCSFQVIPCDQLDNSKLEEKMMDEYMLSLKKEIAGWGNLLKTEVKKELKKGEEEEMLDKKQELKTLYFGGGTPNKMGAKRMIEIIDYVAEYFDLEVLGELSIELNPYPEEETLQLIKTIQRKYKTLPRIRRSIGLQTFDIDILQESGRAYSFPAIADFLRQLREIKELNTVFNFDFIAFGKLTESKKGNKYLRDAHKQKFFQEFVESGFADGFSLYTLELFSGSERAASRNEDKIDSNVHDLIDSQQFGTSDEVYDEFSWLKEIVINAGYNRYELSNFANKSKDSIHNRIYRNMENYIGVGTSASSFINLKQGQFANSERKNKLTDKFGLKLNTSSGLRFTNSDLFGDYIKGNYINAEKTTAMTEKDYLIEKFFLSLRTNTGIENISEFESILEKNREDKAAKFVEQDLCILFDTTLILTDKGMDLFNTVVTELLSEI